MNKAFPYANVENFEQLVGSIELPDKNDRHILACAIRCNAELIVTSNVRDFPISELAKYDVEAQKPDEFISNLIDINPKLGCIAFNKLVTRLKNPKKTMLEVLETFEKCGLHDSAFKLGNYC